MSGPPPLQQSHARAAPCAGLHRSFSAWRVGRGKSDRAWRQTKKEPGIAASRLLRLPHGSKTFRKVAQAFRKRSHAAFRHRKPAQFRQPSIRRDGSSASGLTCRSGRRAASRCVGLLALELNPVSVPESGRSEGHKQRNNCATPSIVQTHASRRRANHFAKSNGFRPLLSL